MYSSNHVKLARAVISISQLRPIEIMYFIQNYIGPLVVEMGTEPRNPESHLCYIRQEGVVSLMLLLEWELLRHITIIICQY